MNLAVTYTLYVKSGVMTLINRYLIKNISYPTISIIAILSAIILITQSLKYVDLMISHGIDGLDFVYVSALLLPSLLFVIMPICLFIAILYSLNKLNAYRELNIFKGVGISDLSISKPILKIALLVTLVHYFIALYWMPIINHQFKDLTRNLKENYVTFFLQERVFIHPTDNLTFYIKNKIQKNKFEGIFYQDRRNDNPIVIVAEQGELVRKDNNIYLNLIKGNRQEISKKNELSVLYFETLLVQLDFDKHLGDIRKTGIQEMSLKQLLFPAEEIDLKVKTKMFAEANHRIIWPFYNIILTLLAIAAVLFGQYSRSGKNKRIFVFSIIAGLLMVINTSLINLGAVFASAIIFSYLFTFGAFALLMYLLFYRRGA